MTRTLVVVTSDSYLDHAKSLLVGCKRTGNWQGRFCLLHTRDTDTSNVDNRGIMLAEAPFDEWNNMAKFYLFHPMLAVGTDQLLYIDCDCLIQGDLNTMCDYLEPCLPSIMMDGPQESTIMDDWVHFHKLEGGNPDDQQTLYEQLEACFPHVHKPIYVSSTMFFNPSTIDPDTTHELIRIQHAFSAINPGCYDQQVMNLLLYDKMQPMGKDCVTWWAFDMPENRVASETRGWRGDENPAIVHYWSMFSPWQEKTPNAGAYFNERLGRPCRDVYLENLSLFDETFPKVNA